MPRADQDKRERLGLAVLDEELAGVEAAFAASASAADSGERSARLDDALRATDRYLRLEREVFHPVLSKRRIPYDQALASHQRVQDCLEQVRSQADTPQPATLAALRSALRSHRSSQARDLFPRADRELGEESHALALELDEVRSRMKGAYGV